MRRETQNVLLLLLGGALLKISINGQYLRYVKPELGLGIPMRPLLIAIGTIAVVLAVIAIVRDLQPSTAAAPAEHDHHQHGSRSPWLLLLPVFAIFLIAPPALGADKVVRSGDRSAASQQPQREANVDFIQLPAEEAPLLKMGDAVTRAIWDDSGSLDGRQIRLVGFVVRMPDGSINLARLVIGCCAADATPIKVVLAGGQADRYPPDTWLEVRGEMKPGSATEANGYTPTFEVSALQEVPAPPDPYEF